MGQCIFISNFIVRADTALGLSNNYVKAVTLIPINVIAENRVARPLYEGHVRDNCLAVILKCQAWCVKITLPYTDTYHAITLAERCQSDSSQAARLTSDRRAPSYCPLLPLTICRARMYPSLCFFTLQQSIQGLQAHLFYWE